MLIKYEYVVEITKESGEIVETERFPSEFAAHSHFEQLEKIRYPNTYKGYTLNLSEYFTGGTIGSARVVVVNKISGDRYLRRELYRQS